MISSLRGTVLAVGGASTAVGELHLEVAGVGYAIAITPQQALELRPDAEAFVWTSLVVREDELALYGFASRDELEAFELLRSVSGVGPKSALGVLAAMTPPEIAGAVEREDDAPFRRVSGIGPKTAKLITVSLAGKLSRIAVPETAPRDRGLRPQALAALVGLGFPERRAAEVIDEVLELDPDADQQSAIRQALALLGPAAVR